QRGDITGMSFMFYVSDEEWKDLNTEKPTRHIREIGAVFEVSAVTFPAYETTEIQARDRKSLEKARQACPSQQLELEKEKFKALFGG
ncbi:MAG: HK97 family phage prohead protease, partial [Oscillospiraceae bacterium]|nr:HK97 family phage prohead protease [Oscillospiraceae bacterium]